MPCMKPSTRMASTVLASAFIYVLSASWVGTPARAEEDPPPSADERIQEFRDDVRKGNKRSVRKAVEEPGFLELVGSNGRTPVFALVAALDVEVVDTVLGAKPDLEFRDPDGKSVLLVAAEGGHGMVIERLLAAGAEVGATDPGGRTALSYAALGGHVETARVLIAGGAEVDVRDRNGATPLIYASVKGFYAVAKVLLEHGADAKATTRDGTSALALAKRKNAQRVVRLLRRHGAT